MLNLPPYPLAEVMDIKCRRRDKAEDELRLRREELEKEKEKLKEVERIRDLALKHRNEKLAQLRHTLDTETDTDEIQRMKRYLEVCNERLAVEEEKVKAQKEQVELAEQAVALAKEELRRRQLEVDKLDEHKVAWTKLAKEELLQAEAAVMDEIGNILYEANKRKYD